ncbi:putative uncharacterized protein (plasmid) [Bacillus thuringiensis serovar tolworthi]|uniref:Uncharacterized protein n=1 Tax=Bacillus thuringiensis subsp. tolworthi TaxID=1442 RepID=A0A9W4EXX9_BACTO|nr:hypothetical protein [Bacillus thuringiensis]BAR87837.1 putative uncharacterized protein [Bacillus thuringiensis serovar tolworthi]
MSWNNDIFSDFLTLIFLAWFFSEMLAVPQEEHYKKALAKSLPKYPNIDNLAKQNLSVIGEVYRNEE